MVDNAKDAAHVKDAAVPGHNGVDLDNALINRLAREREHSTSTQLLADLAPQSAMMRYGTAGVQGLLKVPEGMGKAIVHDIEHPLETAGTLGMAAGTAFVLKTVLPEGGMAGKLAGAAIGLYFTYEAAVPVYDGFKKAGNALTMKDLNAASTQIGDAGGSFVVNSAIAAVGYKLGSNMTDRLLTSRSMDGFADMKANFYDGLGKAGTRLTDTVGITTPTPLETTTQKAAGGTTMDPRSIFAASERAKPVGLLKGDVDPGSSMEVSVMLKSKASDLRVERTLARIAQGRQAPLADAELGSTFGASQKSLDAVTAFAKENGLQVTDANLTSGRVVLKGTAGQFTEAFNTKL
ncbi:MAG: hypothetical protein K2X81_00670 [Candidatus Obscuribacterales bacterium]|nr:hypothetical protein [Candidatus Obscuribacterales bacterium]